MCFIQLGWCMAANVTSSLHTEAELKVRHSADTISVTHTHCPDCDASGVAGSITKGTWGDNTEEDEDVSQRCFNSPVSRSLSQTLRLWSPSPSPSHHCQHGRLRHCCVFMCVCVVSRGARGVCREACWTVSSAGVPGLAPGVHTRANEREKSRRDERRAAKLNELRLFFGINISIKR